MTTDVAILAYGSLICDPGKGLAPLIRRRIEGIQTPFSIEFARSSRTRDGGPTLVPVKVGGSPVKGILLVLNTTVDRAQAENLLWKRETRNESTSKRYCRPLKPSDDTVLIECVENLAGVETVLFTRIGSNIKTLTPEHLAELAICSARKDAGAKGIDGISYLASAIKQGVRTPLLPAYRAAILRKMEAGNLEEAHAKIRSGATGQYIATNDQPHQQPSLIATK